MDNSNPLFELIRNGEIDRFVKEHLQPLDEALVRGRAAELEREGKSSYDAHAMAYREHIEERLDSLYPSKFAVILSNSPRLTDVRPS